MNEVTPKSAKIGLKKRRDQCLFATKHLGVKFPVPKCTQLRDYDFSQEFSAEKLKQLGKDTDGGFKKKGRGSFDSTYNLAVELQQKCIAYSRGEKYEKGLLQKETVANPSLQADYKRLIETAEKWLNKREEGEEKGKALGDRGNVKVKACEDLIKGAKTALKKLELEAELNDPDSQLNNQINQLSVLEAKMRMQGPKPDLVDAYRELDATILAQTCGVNKAGGGTSDVDLIFGPDGTVAYAFKAIDGESTQMGTEKGAGALREVLASKLFEELDKQGFNFGWPQTTLATVPDRNGQMKLGALIEGLPGEPGDECDPALLGKLSTEDRQQFLVGSLAACQLDAKWGNAFIQEAGKGATLRPSDGGGIGPDDSMLVSLVHRGAMPGAALLKDALGLDFSTNQEPMSDDLCGRFFALNLAPIKEALAAELDRASKQGLDPDALGVTAGASTILESIAALQAILAAGSHNTFEMVINRYNDDFIIPTVQERLKTFEPKVISDYANLHLQYPALVPAPKTNDDAMTLWNKYVDPRAQQTLKELDQLHQRSPLDGLGMTIPIAAGDSPSGMAAREKELLTKQNVTVVVPQAVKQDFPQFFSDYFKQYRDMQRPKPYSMFLPAGSSFDHQDLYNRFLTPKAQQILQTIAQVWQEVEQAGDNISLSQLGLAIPITSAEAGLKNLKRCDVPPNVQKKYPDLFKAKK